MTRLASWEKTEREKAAAFAQQVNDAEQIVLSAHQTNVDWGTEGARPIAPDDPRWRTKLLPLEKTHLEVAQAIRAFLRADEEGDPEACSKAMRLIGKLYQNRTFEIAIESDGRGRFRRLPLRLTGDRLFGPTELLLDGFFDYVERTREFLNLGVCHHCGKVYLKTKQGAKMRYCSRACGQKAYVRRLEGAGR